MSAESRESEGGIPKPFCLVCGNSGEYPVARIDADGWYTVMKPCFRCRPESLPSCAATPEEGEEGVKSNA